MIVPTTQARVSCLIVFDSLRSKLGEVEKLVAKVTGRGRFSSWWHSKKDLQDMQDLFAELRTVMARSQFKLTVEFGLKVHDQYDELRSALEMKIDEQNG